MPKPFSREELRDSIFGLDLGINSGLAALLLPKNQLSFANNTTFRGSFATDRPPVRNLVPIYPDPLVQAAVEEGLWQGGAFYQPDFGAPSLFAAISGRLFQFQIVGTVVTVTERTIPGDPNPPGTTQAWLWQSENYLIWNDGLSLPVFFDGTTSRRSNGPSRVLNTTDGAGFVAPAVGQNVTIALTAPFTGVIGSVVIIDGTFWRTVFAGPGYPTNFTTLYTPSGGVVPDGAEVVVIPSRVGYVTSGGYVLGNGVHRDPGLLVFNIGTSAPFQGAVGTYVTIGGRLYGVLAKSPTGLTLNNNAAITGPASVVPGELIEVSGSTDPNVPVGNISPGGSFAIPPNGSTTTTNLTVPFTGPPNSVVWIGEDQFSITTGPDPTPGTSLTITNLNHATGAVPPSIPVYTVPELPPGRMGAYGIGRTWMSLVDGQAYIASDIVGGQSGSNEFNGRDAVLKITENEYLFGGGVFRVPGTKGDIRAMIFAATLDTSLGQGPLQIYTPTHVFSCNAPVDRLEWQDLTNPIQTITAIGNGALGQNSTIAVNSDTQFRSIDGWRSLLLARREFRDSSGNTPISNEVVRILAFDKGDDITPLLAYGSAMVFDNRVLFTAAPVASSQGVFFRATVAMNLDTVTTLQEKFPPIYDGLWTGVNVLQYITGIFSGAQRGFAFSYDASLEKIELYEFLPTGTNHFDNGNMPIVWTGESPVLFRKKGPDEYMTLLDGQMHIDEAVGTINFKLEYKPDQYPCWIPWHDWAICIEQGEGTNPGYRAEMGFGEPSVSNCNPQTNTPFRDFYTCQLKWTVTGHCRLLRIDVRGCTSPLPVFATPICGTLQCVRLDCSNQSDLTLYSLQSGIIFGNSVISIIVNCPEGRTCPPGVFPITITYPPNTFVFRLPDPDPPPGTLLRMDGCSSAVTRVTTPGMTPAQLAALIQEMILEVANQQAICDTFPPFDEPPVTPFTNEAFSLGCTANRQLTAPSSTLPFGFTYNATTKQLDIAAGIVAGDTQALANSNAQNFAEGILQDLLTDGDAECVCLTSFTATPDADSINLAWAAHPLADSYVVERATVSSGPYTQLINTSGTSYDDITAVAGTTYFYVITPRAAGINLCESNEVSVVIGNNIFEDLVWVEQFVVQDGGTASGTFLAENFTASAESTGSWFQAGGNIQYIGTLLYTGDAINCEINITAFSSSSSGVPQPQFSVIITSDADGTLISQVVSSTGAFPFTIPASAGATITVTVEALATNGSEFDTANQTISATGSINGPV